MLMVSFIETSVDLAFSTVYSQKMTISYFVSKREVSLVRRAIKWSGIVILIDLLLIVAFSILMLVLLTTFGSDANTDLGYYIKWAIPIQSVIILAEAG